MRYFSDALFHTTSNGANGLLNPLEPSVCYSLYTYTAESTLKTQRCAYIMGLCSIRENIWAESGCSTTGGEEEEEEETFHYIMLK